MTKVAHTSLVDFSKVLQGRYRNFEGIPKISGDSVVLRIPINATNNVGCLLYDKRGSFEFYDEGYIQRKFALLLRQHGWHVALISLVEGVIILKPAN